MGRQRVSGRALPAFATGRPRGELRPRDCGRGGGSVIEGDRSSLLPQFRRHPRHWRDNLYIYPVISRRSRGLSIGVNLNPDAACNFDCVYCQVDRSGEPRVRTVELPRLGEELAGMIAAAQGGALFADPAFGDVPKGLRRINDIAFSGDGEPTTCKVFRECVGLAAELKRQARLEAAKIVLITDACYLTKPEVVEALAVMDRNHGEIWAKLDAGSEGYYRTVNRPNFPLQHVIDNIIAAGRVRPIVIQSLFMRLHGAGPDRAELDAYTGRLKEILRAGGRIHYVQVYTVARPPAEGFVSALSDDDVNRIAELIRGDTGLLAETFYGAG